ncbi:MAG: hypothetical protein LBF22_01345 [Deltaproteobacteria bacterium]|nr:hypothetical protein [Deltaproteobacteria bacterium]
MEVPVRAGQKLCTRSLYPIPVLERNLSHHKVGWRATGGEQTVRRTPYLFRPDNVVSV